MSIFFYSNYPSAIIWKHLWTQALHYTLTVIPFFVRLCRVRLGLIRGQQFCDSWKQEFHRSDSGGWVNKAGRDTPARQQVLATSCIIKKKKQPTYWRHRTICHCMEQPHSPATAHDHYTPPPQPPHLTIVHGSIINLVWSTLTWLTTVLMCTLRGIAALLTSCSWNVFILTVNWTRFFSFFFFLK